MGREWTVAEQEGSTGKEGSLGQAGDAEEVENTVEQEVPSVWEKWVPLGNLEMGEGSLGAQAQDQCS